MAKSAVMKLTILTKVSSMLKQLQQIYPANQIINQFLTLFEILSAYTVLDSESRAAVAHSCENILRELASMKATLQPYLKPEDQHFSEEDLNKINELLSFDSERILEILNNPEKAINDKL